MAASVVANVSRARMAIASTATDAVSGATRGWDRGGGPEFPEGPWAPGATGGEGTAMGPGATADDDGRSDSATRVERRRRTTAGVRYRPPTRRFGATPRVDGEVIDAGMPTNEIARFILRTTDVAAATAFYDAVLGRHGDVVYPLHENAVARGARPHWLGCVDTPDPEGAAAAFLAAGGERLGPWPGGGMVVRDPGGALIAFGPVATPSVSGVDFHVLRYRDASEVPSLYTKVFGWSFGPDGVGFREMRWADRVAGTAAGIDATPGVHPQWLYFFGVDALAESVVMARGLGATCLPIATDPKGSRYVVGDDPQGAAFGLIER